MQIASGKAREKNVVAKFIVGNVYLILLFAGRHSKFLRTTRGNKRNIQGLKTWQKALIVDMRNDITDEEISS